MKKILHFFTLFALASSMAGCSPDNGCSILFNIENQLSTEIIHIAGTQEIIIKPEGKETVYQRMWMCEKGLIPEDEYTEEQSIFGSNRQLIINDRILSSTIWKRKYWSFDNETSSTRYTLEITDELIESVGFEDE